MSAPSARRALMRVAFLAVPLGVVAGSPWPSPASIWAADAAAPPGATLLVDGRGPFVADIGDFCLFRAASDGHCVDRVPTRLEPLAIQGSDALRLRLPGDWRIDRWDAGYQRYQVGARDGGPIRRLDRGRAPDRDGLAEIAFTGPPAGDWRLDVLVGFHRHEAHGDAAFQWRLSSVPDTGALDRSGADPTGRALLVAAVFGAPVLFGAAWLGIGGRLRGRRVA